MRRLVRRAAWVGVALTVVGLGFGVTVRLLGPEPPGVNETSVKLIKTGMTMKQVEGVLGGPGQWQLTESSAGTTDVFYRWHELDGEATVVFTILTWSENGQPLTENQGVTSASYQRHQPTSPLTCLRSLLGW
jgi:hypothetical protein